MKTDKKLMATGILTAIAASLCCITPVLALIAGISGIASAFNWLDPFRPYLIGLTVLVLGFAWFQKIKPQKTETDCCTPKKKISFLQSKSFLLLITVFAALMLAFPHYSHFFYPKQENKAVIIEKENLQKTEFLISGMTCSGCEAHVENEVNQLQGIFSATASYENGNAIVEFDNSVTTIEKIEEAIMKTGYKITNSKTY